MAVQNKRARIKREAAPQAAPSKRQVKQERKEKLSKTAKIVLVAIGIFAMLLSVSAMACSGVINEAKTEEPYKLTGGVAATVNGVNIKEDTVTKQIMSLRESSYKSDEDWAEAKTEEPYKLTGGVAATVNGVNIKEDTVTKQIMSLRESSYKSDEDWATYLSQQGLTPASYRDSVIDSIARQYLLTQAEKEYKITVSQDDLDKAWKDAVKGYGGDEKAFVDMITQVGFTKETYLENIKSSLRTSRAPLPSRSCARRSRAWTSPRTRRSSPT